MYNIDIIYETDLNSEQCWDHFCTRERGGGTNFCDSHNDKLFTPECPICIEPFNRLDTFLRPCGHWVHIECIYKSGKTYCPLCRCSLWLSREDEMCMRKVVYDEAPGLSPPPLERIGDIVDSLPFDFEGYVTLFET